MHAQLVEALRTSGTASLEVTPSRSVRACRTQLVEAAKEVGVRIEMRRVVDSNPDFVQVTARALNQDEAEHQRRRDTIFRGVNRIRTGVGILTDGTIDAQPIEDQIEDLRDIANELEAYARELPARDSEVTPSS